LKNIENVRVVGQQFPAQEVPRPNGRKVSTAAKNRIKMVAYRLMRHKEDGRILIPEVTQHTAGDSDMQLRQKLKEFLQYNKDNKDWGMIDNRPVPDEGSTRAALPPEDACLVESVQVGQQHLEDAGYAKQGDAEMDDDADEKEGQSVEEQLAPWHTTKNFLMATAGKAMLQLHGEGDPSGRGEAFSMLKTSMKGGFKAIGESAEDKISAKKRKELGGHSYNVAEQNKAYEQSIRKIWDAQYQSLSTNIEHSDMEMDIDDVDERAESMPRGATPRSEMPTPSGARRRDDETMSESSRFTTNSQRTKILKITRKVRNDHGQVEERDEIVRDHKVIRQYLRRKNLRELERIDFKRIKSNEIENNPIVRKHLEDELNRLERNKDRRLTREKQKAGTAGSPGSPDSPAGVTKPAGTQRKCANCGQVGHIKTNKKLCPLLNGTMKQEDGFGDSSFSMTTPGM
jgi:transcription initiation factor TFIID subunit 1